MKKTIHLASSVLLFIILACGGLLFAYALDTYHQIQLTNKINSGYISPASAWFTLKSGMLITPEEASAQLESGCLLYFKPNATSNLLYLYGIQGTTAFPLKEGRQLSVTDFQSGASLAMAGTKVQSSLVPGSALLIEGMEASITGILGLRLPSMLDTMRIVLPSPALRAALTSGIWIIDGNDTGRIEQSWQNIEDHLPPSAYNRIPVEYMGTFHLGRSTVILPVVLTGLSLSVLCAFFALAAFWFHCQKQLISVFILLGLTNRKIIWQLGKRLVWLVAAGLFCGGLAGALLGLLSFPGAAIQWLASSICSASLTVLLLYIILGNTLTKWTVKEIRG